MKHRILACILIVVSTFVLLPAISLAEGKSLTLDVVVRDFKADGKLFEGAVGDAEKLVRSQLGKDRKPDFSDPANPTWPLPQWQKWGVVSPVTLIDLNALFNDAQDRNMTTGLQLSMAYDGDGYYAYDMRSITNKIGFYPIDGLMFGNDDKPHNYYFSMEHHTGFVYNGTESFTIAGDDDIWVFINGKLVIDMGGVHSGAQRTVVLSDLVQSGVLSMKRGDYASLDFFYIDRNKGQSNFYIRTNIDLGKFKCSSWAQAELQKASSFDIIPATLKYSDMTRPITREEFAELVVRLYERTTNEVIFPLKPNPFKDTNNKEIIKAYTIGVATGSSSSGFAPKENISREQVATILSRTIRAMRPKGDFSTDGAPAFSDKKDISAWALEHVLFVSKNSVMTGTDGKFMPRAVTAAQKATGYGNTTREQAVAMCVRAFVKYK